MDLKPGYKQTEIGVIPEDWTVKELGEIAEFANGKPNEQNVVDNGKYLLVTLDSINIRGELKSSHKQTNLFDDSLRAGDIVTVLSDLAHGDLLGLCGVIPLDHKYVLNQRMGRIRVHSGYDPGFIRLKVNLDQNHFKKRGQGTSQRHIYRRDFDCLKIGLPNSVAEQKAIAKALSDVDALIDSLEALLTKKRNIKTGVMQELLTGLTRLPGFTGEWKEVRLGDCASMGSGGTPLSTVGAFYGGDIPWVSISDMTSSGRFIADTEKTLSHAGLANSSAQMFPADTILYAMYASLGECSKAVVELCTSQAILGIKCGTRLLPDFLYYSLVQRKDLVKTMGQQGTQSNLNKEMVENFMIPLPDPAEQKEISYVLSDIDDEIEALHKRLGKTRDLKQGMAQELLTGRTRLV